MTSEGAAARLAAYAVVHAVTSRDAYANLVLHGILDEHGLQGRDAALATELAYGTLRRLGTLDAIIGSAGRDPARLDDDVRDVLRLGAYQLLYTRVAAHAAVATSVDLARAVTRRPDAVAGLVNAVLRRIAERDLDGWLERIAPEAATDTVAALAVRQSHPQWVVEAFAAALDDAAPAELEAALAADNERPEVHLVARPGLVTREELLAEVDGVAGSWSPYAIRLRSGDPARISAVREHRAGVQDEGSQLVALAAANVPLAAGPSGAITDTRWLDMCAGPGGKAALWGALAAQRGAEVTALEQTAHRARLVRRATAGLPVTVHTADATADVETGAYDRVLLDAPCSGLGALRRRPEARWRRRPEDVTDLARAQDALLRAAVRWCRPGGVVAYVTCSPHLAETTERVAALLMDSPVAVEQVDARPYLPGVPDLGDGPTVQMWPHRHGTDAMFLALLRCG